MPTDASKPDNDRRFWDRLAQKYATDPISDEAAYQKKLEITRQHFTPDSDVLEFGCGTGMTAVSHAPHVKHIHATDLSGEMLEIARGRAVEAGVGNISFERVGFEDIDAAPGRFDVVLGLSILHLLEDRDAAIARVHSLLKPGGVFISSTACLGEKMWFFSLIAPIGRCKRALNILYAGTRLIRPRHDPGDPLGRDIANRRTSRRYRPGLQLCFRA